MSNSCCCCSLFQEVQKKPAAVSSGKIVETYDDVSAFMMHCCRLWFLDVINPVNCYIFTVSFCFQQKKQKVKLSRGPEMLSADRIPHTTVGPLGLETDGRDVMSDGSSEGSSQADETLFCGISNCARLSEALPAPKSWTQSRSQHQHQHQHQRSSRRSQHQHQPPQCSGPPPVIRPAPHRL